MARALVEALAGLLTGPVRAVHLTQIDGAPAAHSALAPTFVAAGFRATATDLLLRRGDRR
ncbi:MAG: hypothetical protein KC620_14155 [Myxococcales bacterium]|nr:hypothetical protein [Myxococcales bacterium]